MYQGRYVEHAQLLWLLGLIPVAAGQQAVLGAALRALERPDKAFWAYLVSALATATIGAGVVLTWGLAGAVYVLTASVCVSASGMGWQLLSIRMHGLAGGKSPTVVAADLGLVHSGGRD
jgi:hypothetical protein